MSISDKYLICDYCGIAYPKDSTEKRHDSYPDGCAQIIEDDGFGEHPCFSCNSIDNIISNSQKMRYGWKARCTVCIENGEWKRYKPFDSRKLHKNHPVSRFFDAIVKANVELVANFLSDGIDPNCICQLFEWEKKDNWGKKWVPIWTREKEIYRETDLTQPTTPLKMVVFRLSDCLLTNHYVERFGIVAKMLVDAGANEREALEYAHSRYGSDPPFTTISEVVDVFRMQRS